MGSPLPPCRRCKCTRLRGIPPPGPPQSGCSRLHGLLSRASSRPQSMTRTGPHADARRRPPKRVDGYLPQLDARANAGCSASPEQGIPSKPRGPSPPLRLTTPNRSSVRATPSPGRRRRRLPQPPRRAGSRAPADRSPKREGRRRPLREPAAAPRKRGVAAPEPHPEGHGTSFEPSTTAASRTCPTNQPRGRAARRAATPASTHRQPPPHRRPEGLRPREPPRASRASTVAEAMGRGRMTRRSSIAARSPGPTPWTASQRSEDRSRRLPGEGAWPKRRAP